VYLLWWNPSVLEEELAEVAAEVQEVGRRGQREPEWKACAEQRQLPKLDDQLKVLRNLCACGSVCITMGYFTRAVR